MEKPILFSTEMVKAILDGRKTQTRRVIKPEPLAWYHYDYDFYVYSDIETHKEIKCPYGKPGDTLWVRETWRPAGSLPCGGAVIKYKAGGSKSFSEYKSLGGSGLDHGVIWKPSIHMPRWASRINLLVKNVRAERVQEITCIDIKKEGACVDGCDVDCDCIKDCWIPLWDSINKKRGFGWDKNPWVWVVDFEVKL